MYLIPSICVIAYVCLHQVSAHGKEPLPVPRLSPAVIKALQPKEPQKPVVAIAETWTCLPDFILEDGLCVKPIIEPASLACIGGELINGQCEIEVPFLFNCPSEFKFKDNECKRIVEVGAQFYCPKGYYDDGASCAKPIPSETVLQCDIGELVGDKCIAKDRREYSIKAECPPGSELSDDGICWKEIETFDCSDVPKEQAVSILNVPQQHMPVGKKVMVAKGKAGGRFRQAAGKEYIAFTTTPPPPPPVKIGVGKEMVAVSAPHATRVNVISQVCSKMIQVDALAVLLCPPEFVDTGRFCLKETIRTPVSLCTSGQLKDGICVPSIQHVPKHAGCPKDSYKALEKCWQEEFTDVIKKCPSGFTEIDERCIGGIDDPEYACPVGLELLGNTCIGRVVRPPFVLPAQDLSLSKKY